MAYIAPQGVVHILKNVPIDNSYEHTLYQVSASDQYTKFMQFAKRSFTQQSYTRVSENTMRLEIPVDQIRDYNYLMFQNGAGFPKNRWFYCFITNAEYVNNITTEITFEIDYMQTYYFDFTFGNCFIEREHTATDNFGEHLVDEGIGTDELICHYKSGYYYNKNRLYTVIMYLPNLDKDEPYVNYNNGLPIPVAPGNVAGNQAYPAYRNRFGGALFCLAIPITNWTDIAVVQAAVKMLNSVTAKIVSVFQITGEIYDDNFNTLDWNYHDFSINERMSFRYVRRPNDSFVPKNKKLLQYPFKRLVASNGNGQNAEYRWEYFSTMDGDIPQANFQTFNALMPAPKAFAFPNNYRAIVLDYENGISLEDFPMPCWSEDSFTQWWAQNKTSFGISLAAGLASTAIMASGAGAAANPIANSATEMANMSTEYIQKSANYQRTTKNSERYANLGAIAGIIASDMNKGSGGGSRGSRFALGMGGLNVARTLGSLANAKATPDTANVQNNSAIINLLQDRMGFTFYDMGVSGEMAKVIDQYFTMYGYKVNRLGFPNLGRTKRPEFQYVKMAYVILKGTSSGDLPAEAEKALKQIFVNGITYWTWAANVGNYSLDNSPRGGA